MVSTPLVTTGGVVLTTSGEVILIKNQHAHHVKNKMFNALTQIEFYKYKVDDISIKVGNSQHTTNLDKHKVPMSIRNVLPCIPLIPCTNNE